MATFWRFFACYVFSEPRVADLHLKFTLRPHRDIVWKYVQCPTAEIRRGKKRRTIYNLDVRLIYAVKHLLTYLLNVSSDSERWPRTTDGVVDAGVGEWSETQVTRWRHVRLQERRGGWVALAATLVEQQVRVLRHDSLGGNLGHQMIVEQIPRVTYWTSTERYSHSVRKFSDSTAVLSHWSRPHNKYSLQYL